MKVVLDEVFFAIWMKVHLTTPSRSRMSDSSPAHTCDSDFFTLPVSTPSGESPPGLPAPRSVSALRSLASAICSMDQSVDLIRLLLAVLRACAALDRAPLCYHPRSQLPPLP